MRPAGSEPVGQLDVELEASSCAGLPSRYGTRQFTQRFSESGTQTAVRATWGDSIYFGGRAGTGGTEYAGVYCYRVR